MIQSIYENSKTTVKYALGLIKSFNANDGKHQESALTSFLLAVVVISLNKGIRGELILC